MTVRPRAPRPWIIAALLVAAARAASAQVVDPVCTNRQLRPGLVLRVQTFSPGDTARGSVVGPMVRCEGGYLVLGAYPGQDEPEYRVPTPTVHRLWIRGDARLLGFIAGASAGAAAGAGLGATRSQVCFRGTPPVFSHCHGDITADALIGGAVGGLLGWVLGRGFPHWSRILP